MKRTRLTRRKPLRPKRRAFKRRASDLYWETARCEAFERAGHACERCSTRHSLTGHHRLPRSRGGTHEQSNIAVLCFDCHRAVHDHTVSDWGDWIESRKSHV